jgi:hypothetical protein
MVEKSDLKSVALICGTAPDVFAEVAVDEGVVDELQAEAMRPNESMALVSATDLRAVPIRFPSVSYSPPV